MTRAHIEQLNTQLEEACKMVHKLAVAAYSKRDIKDVENLLGTANAYLGSAQSYVKVRRIDLASQVKAEKARKRSAK